MMDEDKKEDYMMNPGIIEGTTQVASDVIKSLQSAPVLIALVVLQGFTLAGIAWSIHERAGYAAEERRMFSEERKSVLEILEKCTVPDGGRPTP
jgi:hypothetical protein